MTDLSRPAGSALIVGDSAARGAVSAARSLAAAGWEVGVGTPDGRGLAASSRLVSSAHRVPSPAGGTDPFVQSIDRARGRRGSYDLIFGTGDAEILALSRHRGELSCRVPYASDEVVRRTLDKLALYRVADAVGLDTPRTVEASERALDEWQPPFIVKPRLHASLRVGAPERLEAEVVESRAAAAARVRAIQAAGGDALLQELLSGRLLALSLVSWDDGRIVSRSQQIAERTWPARAGVSARAQTVPVDENLCAGAARLLRELGWLGLAQLQFIVPDASEPRLIDLNGRFYGSLALAVAAGASHPASWAELAAGREPSPSEARPGVRYQWIEGDLRRAVLEPDSSVMADIRSTIRYGRTAVHSVWSRHDPGPGLNYLTGMLGRAARRGARDLPSSGR